MGFLSRVGKIALEVTKLLTGLEPLVKVLAPDRSGVMHTVVDSSAKITDIIQTAEVMGQALALPGDRKLVAATPLVAQVILKSDALAGKKISNPTLFQKGVQSIASGWADILNSLDGDSVKADAKT